MTFSVVLFLLVGITGFFFFLFSQSGNEMLRPYVEQRLEEKIGMPVEVRQFTLESGASTLDFVVNKQAVVNVVTQYDMWSASFEGNYRVQADQFSFEERQFTKADLTGNFKGNTDDIHIDGEGTLLDGEIDYSLNIIDDVPQQIIVKMQGLQLSEILQLNGYPALARGEVDININMPNIGEDGATGDGHIVLKKAYFDRNLVKELYQYTLPKNSYISATIDTTLAGKDIHLDGDIQSNLFMLKLTKGLIDAAEKSVITEYDLLIPNSSMPKGVPARAQGTLQYQDTLSILGVMKDMGEKVSFSYDSKSTNVDASKLLVEKILPLIGVPAFVKGNVDSKVELSSMKPVEGEFWVKGSNLITDPKEMKKLMGEGIDAKIALETSGTFKEGIGYIASTMKSTLGNISLPDMVYDIEKKTLRSSYVIDIPDLNKLRNMIDKKLYGPLVLKGNFSKDHIVNVKGSTQTLGGNIDYLLVGDKLSSTISHVPLENMLAMLGYKKGFLGKSNGQVKYNIKNKSGVVDLDIASFQIKPSRLTNVISLAIGKDPAREIFSSTKFHADINGNIINYTLHATGTRSSIDITEGRFNQLSNTNTAKFKFVYEKYTVIGKIKGTTDNPKVTIDTSSLLKGKIDEKLQDKLDDVIGGKAGEFLKGLKF